MKKENPKYFFSSPNSMSLKRNFNFKCFTQYLAFTNTQNDVINKDKTPNATDLYPSINCTPCQGHFEFV